MMKKITYLAIVSLCIHYHVHGSNDQHPHAKPAAAVVASSAHTVPAEKTALKEGVSKEELYPLIVITENDQPSLSVIPNVANTKEEEGFYILRTVNHWWSPVTYFYAEHVNLKQRDELSAALSAEELHAQIEQCKRRPQAEQKLCEERALSEWNRGRERFTVPVRG